MQLMQLPFVLNAALRKEDVSSLPVVVGQTDPVDWLQEYLEVAFPADSEIMQVTFKTRDPEYCKKIVNAIVDAYLNEVVLNERNAKLQRLYNLERVYSEAETKLQSKRNELKSMASALGTSDSDSLTVAQQNALQQYGLMQEKLIEVQFQLLQAEGQYKVAKEYEERLMGDRSTAQQQTDTTLSSFEPDLNQLPDIVKLEDEVESIRIRLASLEDSWGKNHPSMRKAARELSTRQQLLEKRKRDARASLSRRPVAAMAVVSSTDGDRSMLDRLSIMAKVEVYKNQEAILQRQVNQLSDETRQLGRTSIDIELMRSEIKGLESVLLRVGEEIERTSIELKTAPRIRLLSAAEMSSPPDIKKRLLMFNWIRVAILMVGTLTSMVAVGWFKSKASAVAEVPRYSLVNFPKQIGEWVGQDVTVKDDTVEVLGAHAYINRLYRDRSGKSVYLHIAIWTNEVNLTPAPHHPDVCYPAAGWQILSRQSIALRQATGQLPLEFILFQKLDQSLVTGHWFQMGNSRYTHAGNLFSQRLDYFGAPSWPYSIKVLLQTNAANIQAVQPMLEDFSKLVSDQLDVLSGSNSQAVEMLPSHGSVNDSSK